MRMSTPPTQPMISTANFKRASLGHWNVFQGADYALAEKV
jgi:hypothetical protein